MRGPGRGGTEEVFAAFGVTMGRRAKNWDRLLCPLRTQRSGQRSQSRFSQGGPLPYKAGGKSYE
jgi:hypothetical protein